MKTAPQKQYADSMPLRGDDPHPTPTPGAIMLDRETGLDFANKDHQPTLERHLIGACLADTIAFDEAAEVVDAGDFVLEEHAIIFREMHKMRSQGRQISAADLFEHLVRTHRTDLHCFGGNASWWLYQTCELEPIGTRARYYAIHIREAATFRRLRGVASEITGFAYKPFGPASEVLGRAESMLFDLTNSAGPKKDSLLAAGPMMASALQRIDDRAANGGRLMGIPSGFMLLDNLLAGFRPGQMVVIGARPSIGKTALALNIAGNVAANGHGVLFFSLEMPQVEIADRLLVIGSGVSMHKINSGTGLEQDELQRLIVTASPEGIGGCDLFVDDNSAHTGDSMLQVSRRACRKFGISMIVVDYLQLIQAENTRVNRNEQVGTLARKAKHMALELKLPVLCLAQLNRELEARGGEPKLSDLRDSGEIEQHADAVILLHQLPNQDNNMKNWNIDAIVAKNRNGPKGTANLEYLRSAFKFKDRPLGF